MQATWSFKGTKDGFILLSCFHQSLSHILFNNIMTKKATPCSHEGCTNQALRGGVCQRHGGKPKLCKIENCTNQSKRGGVCVRHGAVHIRCKAEGCTNKAMRKGVCRRHGAKPTAQQLCTHEGCTNEAKRKGVCSKHGATRKRCSVEGCDTEARQGGLCKKHGGGNRTLCSRDGCETLVLQGGLCWKHGANALVQKKKSGGDQSKLDTEAKGKDSATDDAKKAKDIKGKDTDGSTKIDTNIKANDADEEDVTLGMVSGKRSANDEEEDKSSNKRGKFSGLSKEEWTV